MSRGHRSRGKTSRGERSQGQEYYDADTQGQQSREHGTQVVDEYTQGGDGHTQVVDEHTQGGDEEYTEEHTEDYTQDGTATLPDCYYLMQHCSQAFAPKDPSTEAAELAADSWTPVRDWLASHETEEIRNAAEMRDNDGMTAIHFACQNAPPIDIVETLLTIVPEILQVTDVRGYLPIHYACVYWTESDVIKLLAERFPESKTTTDRKGRTPLHYFLFSPGRARHDAHDVVLSLCNTGAASYPTEDGLLPLHLACAYGSTEETLYVLLDAYPEAVRYLDDKQRTPLHFVLSNVGRKTAPAFVRILLSSDPSLVNAIGDGPLPLLVLAQCAKTSIDPNDAEQEAAVQGCLKQLMLAQPKPTPRLFSALQRLPDYLRDQAVIMRSVQEMLNRKIAERFTTMILIFDLVVQLSALVAYSMGVMRSQSARRASCGIDTPIRDCKQIDPEMVGLWYVQGDDWTPWFIIVGMYLGAVYFIFRELLQCISLAFMGVFNIYIKSPTTWLNLLHIAVLLVFATLVLFGYGDFEWFVIGSSYSVSVLFLRLLIYLRNVYIDFAIFIGGLMNVLYRLGAFLICVLFFLAGFVQFITTLFQETTSCSDEKKSDVYYGYNVNETEQLHLTYAILCDEYEPEPWCDKWSAFKKLFTMFLGEVDDVLFHEAGALAIVFFVLFMLMMVILLANLLIAIVTDSYKVIQDQRAAIVFWSNRLDFIAQMDAVSNGPWLRKILLMMGFGSKKKEIKEVTYGADTWDHVMEILFDKHVEGGNILYFLVRLFLIIIVVPSWLCLGAITAGILWPPQIRAALFPSNVTKLSQADEEDNLRKNQIETLHAQIEEVRNEIAQELAIDRSQLVQMRSLVQERKMEIQSELKHIKRAMTMLFEQQAANAVYDT